MVKMGLPQSGDWSTGSSHLASIRLKAGIFFPSTVGALTLHLAVNLEGDLSAVSVPARTPVC